MNSKAVVLKVGKSEIFGKKAKVFINCDSYFDADLICTGIERMKFRGEYKGSESYIACRIEHINRACASMGAVLVE